MKTLYKIFRTLILLCIGLALGIPPVLYVALELDCVQNPARKRAEAELSRLLNADVSIGSVSIAPFNRATLRDVTVSTAPGDTLASISHLGAGVDLYTLVLQRRFVIGYAEIIGLKGRIHRANPGAPTNLQPIIDVLKPKDKKKEPTRFDLAVNTIVIRRSMLSYDVDSIARPADNRFSPDHIVVTDLRADVRMPELSNENIVIDVNRLAFNEQCGFKLSGLNTKVLIGGPKLTVIDPTIELPHSVIKLSTVTLPVKGNFMAEMKKQELSLAIMPGSHLTPSDLGGFVPVLANLNADIELGLDIEGTLDRMIVNRLSMVTDGESVALKISDATLENILSRSPDSISATIGHLDVNGYGSDLAELLNLTLTKQLTKPVVTLLGNLGAFNLLGHGDYSRRNCFFAGSVLTAAGSIDLEANAAINGVKSLETSVTAPDYDLGQLLADVVPGGNRFGPVELAADINLSFMAKRISGNAKVAVDHMVYRNRTFNDIEATASIENGRDFKGELTVADSTLSVNGGARFSLDRVPEDVVAFAEITDADFSTFSPFFKNRRVSAEINGRLSSTAINDAVGELLVSDLRIVEQPDGSPASKVVTIDNIHAAINGESTPKRIDVSSPLIDMSVRGRYDFTTICREVSRAVASVFPALMPDAALATDDIVTDSLRRSRSLNDFEFRAQVKSSEPIEQLVKLPVSIIYPVEISGRVAPGWPFVALDVDAPYVQQGKKLITGTRLYAAIDGTKDASMPEARLELSTTMPAKTGHINLEAILNAFNNRIDTRIGWLMDREREFSGKLNFATEFMREPIDSDGGETKGRGDKLLTRVHFNPGRFAFNDTIWTNSSADITYSDKRLTIDGFSVGRPGQEISINGVASQLADDSVHVALRDVNLDYVFETLGINNAMFGGRATGNFFASAAFSPEPRLYTDDLHVDGIKYNYCRMGDADIRSRWDVAEKAVVIEADIMGENNNLSKINGFIKPLTEELDFRFHADDVPVGFMLPFMEAFTSAIDGHASGDAHLYGTFKLLDMTGDLFARDFKLKIDFTNCWYATTDSIKLRPGRIDIPGVTITDLQGHTAHLNGLVTHTCFKEPRFDFNVTDADHLLVYNVGPSADAVWYGTIFGNGGASIKGEPGRIDIGVNMAATEGSSFTFTLSDTEEAYDYNFLTFRDRTPKVDNGADIIGEESPDKIIERLQNRIASKISEQDIPSLYMMDIKIDVRPSTLVTLIMDPVGGDRIRAHGSGSLGLNYNSRDEDLKIFGTYTVNDGSYNFTLQDIIIKEFSIEDGSEIKFTGNPYAPELNVKAVYSLNANLTDLDESFSVDKELSRTNVPIQALMKVSGDIRQPAIDFDLRFPTLTEDTYRKVKSIISTDEMMNRQIIYLLALNRFYTPDYMSATRGNELVSVASSTISSQLANILGQLSENWSIAPNFRSDRGDFSDLEFDVALSSNLLNNRLLFNGNLGYRDKSMNNNSFIGDFDIEYLLNRSGSLRLKAYNRYNDRNFYVKSALTTQGVGLLYRRDFDRMFNFLRRHRKPADPESPNTENAADSIKQGSGTLENHMTEPNK